MLDDLIKHIDVTLLSRGSKRMSTVAVWFGISVDFTVKEFDIQKSKSRYLTSYFKESDIINNGNVSQTSDQKLKMHCLK